jgi:hypothetical protein
MDPIIDHAVPVLQAATNVDDPTKADLHDVFHQSKDPDELTRRLQALGSVPAPVASGLIAAKHHQMGARVPTGDEALDKGFAVIDRLGGLDQAESHPKIATALISLAAKAREKQAGEAQEKPAESGKGKAAKNPQTQPESALVEPDIPPTPSGHSLVLASDGGTHHIPTENMHIARKIDPNLSVLHVEP